MARSNPISRKRFWESVDATIELLKRRGYNVGEWSYNNVFRYMSHGEVPAFELVDTEWPF